MSLFRLASSFKHLLSPVILLMPLLYSQHQRLEGEHKGKITSLAFSTSGSYLAVASLDGKLSVWSTATGKEVYAVQSGATENVAILSIVWTTPSENQLLCGLANGVVISVHANNQVWQSLPLQSSQF